LNSKPFRERKIRRKEPANGIGWRIPGQWFLGHLAQNCIHQSRRGTFPRPLDQLHGFVDSGARWNAVKKQKLVNAQSESDPNLDVSRARRFF